jgi:hypothetical protein
VAQSANPLPERACAAENSRSLSAYWPLSLREMLWPKFDIARYRLAGVSSGLAARGVTKSEILR